MKMCCCQTLTVKCFFFFNVCICGGCRVVKEAETTLLWVRLKLSHIHQQPVQRWSGLIRTAEIPVASQWSPGWGVTPPPSKPPSTGTAAAARTDHRLSAAVRANTPSRSGSTDGIWTYRTCFVSVQQRNTHRSSLLKPTPTHVVRRSS